MIEDDDFYIVDFIEGLEQGKKDGSIIDYTMKVNHENGYVDFFIKPTKPVKYIPLKFTTSNTGIHFEEIK